MRFLKDLLHDRDGATAIEYGLIVALLSIAVVASMQAMSTQLQATWTGAANSLSSANA